MIKPVKILFVTTLLFSIALAAQAEDAAQNATAQATDNSCKAEANASGCGNLVAGKGLLRCMSAYKMEHRDLIFSNGCSESMKRMRQDSTADKK